MGLYQSKIFPALLEKLMAQSTLDPWRRELVANLKGKGLEVGFGTGLNLPFYTDQVTSLDAIEPEAALGPYSAARIAAKIKDSPLGFSLHHLGGESLPFEDETFDFVVSSWTLCSIKELEKALREIYRVLKPEGTFHFIEHGLSDKPKIKFWQNLLNPIQKRVGQGCNLNRDYRPFVEAAGFTFKQIDVFAMDQVPSLLNPAYFGRAAKTLG
ncbi:MAG: class I SAM-dependent methyltransferase [SAR324 cluster bacterium]|nr:class I SAM-dependent methyltransferase [SAR324 cluster bacterium]